MRIQEAYDFLLKPIEQQRAEKEFLNYFPKNNPLWLNDITLSEQGTIDLRLEISIHEEFEDIRMRFSRLEKEHEKRVFAEKYTYLG